MKKILGIVILGLFAVAAFSMRAFAADEICCQGMKMGKQGKMMEKTCGRMEKKMDLEEKFSHKAQLILENSTELGLSEDQIMKVKALKTSVKKSMIKSKADIDVLAIDIEEALKKDEIDVNSVNALIEKKYSLKGQEAKAMAGAYAELKMVLSKDQMKKLHEIWDKKKMEKGTHMMMEGKEERKNKMGTP